MFDRKVFIRLTITILLIIAMLCIARYLILNGVSDTLILRRMSRITSETKHHAILYSKGELDVINDKEYAIDIDEKGNAIYYTIMPIENLASAEIGIFVPKNDFNNGLIFFGIDLATSNLFYTDKEYKFHKTLLNPFRRYMIHSELADIFRGDTGSVFKEM